jgi:hypothetical protein
MFWESRPFTRERFKVRSLLRPPFLRVLEPYPAFPTVASHTTGTYEATLPAFTLLRGRQETVNARLFFCVVFWPQARSDLTRRTR